MSPGVRIIIFTADDAYATSLRHDLLGIDGVKIVAEVDDTILLAQAAQRFPADVVIIDLDPVPDEVLPIASALAMERRDLSVFALSKSTDGQLILAAMRAGIAEFLTKPLDVELITLALEKVANRRGSESKTGKLVTVIGSAGGVGATTVACNLAVELADLVGTGRVALVDLDYRFGHVATMLDIQPRHTIADLADSAEELETAVIERAMNHHDSGVHVLARPSEFTQADMITAAHCAGILSALQSLYDYVVVDGPNRFDMGSKAVLDISDLNLLVIQLLVTSVRNVHRIVEAMRSEGFNLERVRILCNRVGKDSGSVNPDDVEDMLNHKINFTVPDEWQTVSAAINMGIPLHPEYSKTKVRLALRHVAERVFDPRAADGGKGEGKGKSGLLSKMFSKA